MSQCGFAWRHHPECSVWEQDSNSSIFMYFMCMYLCVFPLGACHTARLGAPWCPCTRSPFLDLRSPKKKKKKSQKGRFIQTAKIRPLCYATHFSKLPSMSVCDKIVGNNVLRIWMNAHKLGKLTFFLSVADSVPLYGVREGKRGSCYSP